LPGRHGHLPPATLPYTTSLVWGSQVCSHHPPPPTPHTPPPLKACQVCAIHPSFTMHTLAFYPPLPNTPNTSPHPCPPHWHHTLPTGTPGRCHFSPSPTTTILPPSTCLRPQPRLHALRLPFLPATAARRRPPTTPWWDRRLCLTLNSGTGGRRTWARRAAAFSRRKSIAFTKLRGVWFLTFAYPYNIRIRPRLPTTGFALLPRGARYRRAALTRCSR